MNENQLLTPLQAAKICNVSKQTLVTWDNLGKIPAVKTPGGHRRFRLQDIMVKISNRHLLHTTQIPENPSHEITFLKTQLDSLQKKYKAQCNVVKHLREQLLTYQQTHETITNDTNEEQEDNSTIHIQKEIQTSTQKKPRVYKRKEKNIHDIISSVQQQLNV
jgi:excisionase family DNA binding protein